MSRPPLKVAEPEPEFEPSDDAAHTDSDGHILLTKAQSAKLHAVFGDLAITDRDYKLRVVAAIIGRPVASSSEVTKAEAMLLIDTLESIASREKPAEHLAFIVDTAEVEVDEWDDDGDTP